MVSKTLIGIILLVMVLAIAVWFYAKSVPVKEPITRESECIKWMSNLNPSTKEEYNGQPPEGLYEFCVGRYHCVGGRWVGPEGPCQPTDECFDSRAAVDECIYTPGKYFCVGDDKCSGKYDPEALRKMCIYKCENLLKGG